ncbi:MAG: RtcB family protein [Candidatus Tritonobacter lacicola]|nr:RtcB family protein [Candidatus Tritonobacter lacicola]
MEERELKLKKIDDFRWEIPRDFQPGMRVPGLIFASEDFIGHIRKDKTFRQVANVACLPGIVRCSMAMPDIHWGYGFPIGGVAAFDPAAGGVISPGGVGYDINCGVRLVRTGLEEADLRGKVAGLIDALFRKVPCGVGSHGIIRLSRGEERKVLERGSGWAVRAGYGRDEDIEFTEEGGCLDGADPDSVSPRACERGLKQVGTLGSGNHFLEIQVVEEVLDSRAASVFGLAVGQVTVMIHCGSRGFGHQVCDDFLRKMGEAATKYGISLPDRQLACAPADSPEGRDYFGAMACAANYAWANRQVIMHWVREAFEEYLGASPRELGMDLVYDVAHNMAKFETHLVDGREVRLCVHRKGATRAFPPGHPEVPSRYGEVGQPVIIPGDMGRNSYLLAGTEQAMRETWGSTCHGAGRMMSRTAARRAMKGRHIEKELLQKRGIVVKARSWATLSEEAPMAYKDVNDVVEVVQRAGISRKVVKLRPLGVIKG